MVLILAGGLAVGQQSRSSTMFVAFVVSLQLQNTVPDQIAVPHEMSAITKQLHFQSMKVIPYSVFYSVPNSIELVKQQDVYRGFFSIFIRMV